MILLWLAACSRPSPAPPPADDGFFLAVNLPWRDYGVDFHTTAWGDATLASNQDDVRAMLATVAGSGARSVRWWLLADGRGAPLFDADGTPEPADDELLANVGVMLDLADEAGLTVVPVLIDFGWCEDAQDVGGVTLGGHASVLTDPARRKILVDDVITPIAEVAADSPALAAWDVFNEPEWVFDQGCPEDAVQAYVSEATSALHAVDGRPVMVGSASYLDMVDYWEGGPTDVLQFHDYHEDLSSLDADLGVPVVVGEFPTKGHSLTDALDVAYERGFAGAAPWSAFAQDDATDLDLDELKAWTDDHDVRGDLE